MSTDETGPALHAGGTGNWMISPEVLDFLESHVQPDSVTVETGAGYSTIALSRIGAKHTAITPAHAEIEAITQWCQQHRISLENTEFAVGFSQDIVPTFTAETDLVLVDGGHGFPIPALDTFYLGRGLKVGGYLLIDDVDIWTGAIVVDQLKTEPEWSFEGLLNRRTAVFRKVAPSQVREWTEQPLVVSKSRWGRFNRQARNGVDRVLRGDFSGLRAAVSRTAKLARARRSKP